MIKATTMNEWLTTYAADAIWWCAVARVLIVSATNARAALVGED